MEYKDYYQILGVEKNADGAVIKKAYRKLARRYHPDFNKDDPEAEKKFKEINEAYQVLSDPEKRRKYDQLGANWDKYRNYDFRGAPGDFFGSGASAGGGFQDFSRGKFSGFSDFFKTFFGGFDLFGGGEDIFSGSQTRSRPTSARPRSITAEVQITVREAVQGTRKQFTLNREQPCSQCGGRGVSPDNKVCTSCFGRGIVFHPETLEVRIPAGVEEGSKVRVPGKGGAVTGSNARGDLLLVIRILGGTLFRLEGRDIHCDIPISVSEAVLGAEIDVPTATGKVRMRIPPETQNLQTFRLKGKGLPPLGRKPGGDQIITVKVVLPRNLSAREKELFHELAKLRRENPRSEL